VVRGWQRTSRLASGLQNPQLFAALRRERAYPALRHDDCVFLPEPFRPYARFERKAAMTLMKMAAARRGRGFDLGRRSMGLAARWRDRVSPSNRVLRLHPYVILAVLVVAGCSSVQPCDHEDLQSKHGWVCTLVGYEEPKASGPGCLVGTVTADSADGPIVVVAYNRDNAGVHVVDASVLPHAGAYSLAVPPGAYRLAAFADRNRDLRYDAAHERAALYLDGRSVRVRPGRRADRLDLTLRQNHSQALDFELDTSDVAAVIDAGHASACSMPPAST
jgi:hypothetical protein